ncbi:class I SAM-dependent methyltransferase [Caballeronia sp. 15711]|uniref:class I SAM-dependent methyltransferase n=1 Tax=Caballeronia sp. 15711 TaxID=3391029 RepID=UPI0039E48599
MDDIDNCAPVSGLYLRLLWLRRRHRELGKSGSTLDRLDLSPAAVEATKIRVPSASIERRDVRDPRPEDAVELGVALASRSLHYFAWEETVSIVDRVRLALRPGGVLLCCLNSTEDRNFGAAGFEEIEPNYFLVNGQPKRFFDESAVSLLFVDGWNPIAFDAYFDQQISATDGRLRNHS